MTEGYLPLGAAYGMFGLVVVLFEAWRVRRSGPDPITIFVALLLLQTCVAGVLIFGFLSFVDPNAPTGNDVLDRIYQATDGVTALVVLAMVAWFTVFFYVGCAVGGLAFRYVVPGPAGGLEVSVRCGRLLLLLGAGAAVTLLSFYLLGESWLTRYTNLILFRSEVPEIERNALNANALSLTQTWAWLSVLAVFVVARQRGRGLLWLLCLGLTVGFAVLGVSRRALLLPLLLSYFVLVLYRGRWRLGWILVGVPPMILLLAFGKDLLSALAFGGGMDAVVGNYESWATAMLRAGSDLGITLVESQGTLSLVHSDLRFGVDHLLSIARRFPEGMLGFDINFPDRVVRLATETFADPSAQDIPPGLLGQMWLDFGVVGPVVWGLVLGLQMSVVRLLFRRTRNTPEAAALFVLVVFVVALPLNTGSLDFTFSIDIFVLAAALWWCVRLRHGSAASVTSPMPVSAAP